MTASQASRVHAEVGVLPVAPVQMSQVKLEAAVTYVPPPMWVSQVKLEVLVSYIPPPVQVTTEMIDVLYILGQPGRWNGE